MSGHIAGFVHSKESIHSIRKKHLTKILQVLWVKRLGLGEGILFSQHVILVLAKLMEGQKLNASGTDLSEPPDKACCILCAVVIAGDDGEPRQNLLALLYGKLHIGKDHRIGYAGRLEMFFFIPMLDVKKQKV